MYVTRKNRTPKNITPQTLRHLDDASAAALKDILTRDLSIVPEDPREVRELKQIINGIRAEFQNYLQNGNGTVHSFWRRLLERTTQETQIFTRTQRELQNETDPRIWETKNESLRRLGLRTIPNPHESE